MRDRFIFSRSNNTLYNTGGAGFTLIEVLIVVALIGILTGGFIILINPKAQLQKARDSQRKSHLRQIQSAIEVYRADCGAYPTPTLNSLGTSLTAPASCSSSTITYMQTVPVDPETKKSYYYCTSPCPFGIPASALYTIFACLENTKPPIDPEAKSESPSPGEFGCGETYYIRWSNP